MNLVLDLGNTSGKIAVCEGNEVVEAASYPRISSKEIAYFHLRYPHIRGTIISSVVNYSRELIDYLGNLYNPCIELNAGTPLPVINSYKTPETLGGDRLAAVVGAHTLYPDQPCLVIDAGTAITFDLVTARGEYLGGNISPGMEVRFKALHKFTSRLPQLERPDETPGLLGTKTREAIQWGTVRGIVYEMDGCIDEIARLHSPLQVLITGGDANYFAGLVKNSIFVNQNLNLIGLNRILEHNATQHI
ncbi:MAG: type III pantothenate kinase [Bacteroidales bacterium]